MYNPNTLSKMAEQKRQDIHRYGSLRRLAEQREAQSQPLYSNIVQHLVSFIQRQSVQFQQSPSTLRLVEDVESKG